jgi:membrane protease YdiL (CAAX protease family)
VSSTFAALAEQFHQVVDLGRAPAPTGLALWTERLKPFFPIPALLVILPLVWLFFRQTWRELDEEAHRHRGAVLAAGKSDPRPLVALAMAAVILTMQEYYGGRGFYDEHWRPLVLGLDAKIRHGKLELYRFDELFGFAWWATARVGGYVAPFALWKIFFPHDSLLDFGLRTKGFFKHAWIYLLFLGVVLPAMFLVSRQPDFGGYYPFYRLASRSWLDLLLWEAMYFAQFFALEMFFRGWWLGALKTTFGSGAIFAMAVPYCMIHFGKPYLEVNGAIVAGVALGSLSMRTKSIYQGFLVHVTVAGLMDWLSLHHRHALPTVFWPPHA